MEVEPLESPKPNVTFHRPTTPRDVFNSLLDKAKTPSKIFQNISSTVKSILKRQRYGTSTRERPHLISSIPPDTKSNSPYPLLDSLHIPTDFTTPEKEMKIENIMRELVKLHQNNQRDVTFKWSNGKTASLVVVERAHSREYFFKKEREWIMSVLRQMNPSNLEEAADCLCSWLVKKFGKAFEDVAKRNGLVRFRKLKAKEMVAFLDQANITHNACNILMRHLHHHLGVRLVEPLTAAVAVGHYPTTVHFGNAKIAKEKGKKEEDIGYYVMDVCDTFAADVERVVNDEEKTNKELTNLRPKYGYETEGKETVHLIAGNDHGQKASRYVARLNLLPSSERRKNGRIDYGSRQITFSKTVCKKDTYEILCLTAPQVLECFERVKTFMFIGERDDKGEVRVRAVPKKEHVDTDQCWVVIPGFTLFICGDLAWYATAMGRDGTSPFRCPYCKLHHSDFQDKDKEGEPLTLKDLNDFAQAYKHPENETDTHGVKHDPMIQVDPTYMIAPVLHIEIGTVNKVLASLLEFIDRFVATLPKVEVQRRKKLDELNETLVEQKKEVEQLREAKRDFTSKRVEANAALKETLKELKAAKKEQKRIDLSPAARLLLGDSVNALQEEADTRQSKFQELKDLADYVRKEYDEKEERRLETSKKRDATKKSCNKMKKGRKGDKEGMGSLVEGIMDDIANIRPEAYFAGALNGMSCQRLVQRSEEIMKRLSELCLETHSQRNDDWGYEQISTEELTNKLNLYTTLFGVLDVVFSLIRQPAPTEGEIKKLEFMIGVLEMLWRTVELSVTVKAHILFKHVVAQVKQFGGIADKVEDFVEKAHQDGRNLDELTKRMGTSFQKKQETQLNRQWAATDPGVQRIKQEVSEASRRTKRARDNGPVGKDNITSKKRAEKLARRQATVASFWSE